MHIGIDVGSQTLVVAIHETQQTWTVPNTPAGIARLQHRLATCAPGAPVVLEATGHWDLEVAWTLQEAGHPVRRLNPKQARDIARAWGYRTKTDAVDARVLARMATQFPAAPPPLPARRQQILRELRALRDALVAERKAHKQRAKAATQALVRDVYTTQIAQLTTTIKQVEAQLTAHIAALPDLAVDAALLATIPGIGTQSAQALVLGIPDIATSTPKQLASLLGVAPHAQDSGVHRGTRRCAGGRAQLRHALWMAALSARHCNPPLRAFADRLAAKGKPHKVIITAVLRKLLSIAHAVLRTQTPWRTPAQLDFEHSHSPRAWGRELIPDPLSLPAPHHRPSPVPRRLGTEKGARGAKHGRWHSSLPPPLCELGRRREGRGVRCEQNGGWGVRCV